MDKNVHFITYADHKYEKSRKRILNEAEKFGVFKTIKGYTPNDLTFEFSNKFRDVLCLPRGGGFWIWKYDIMSCCVIV